MQNATQNETAQPSRVPSPGPWKAMPSGAAKRFQVRGPNEAGPTGEFICTDAREANAHLIAAAPDLLDALKWLADSVAASQESPEAHNWHHKDVQHGLDLARAAIAKAANG